jgi:hypothetical protein
VFTQGVKVECVQHWGQRSTCCVSAFADPEHSNYTKTNVARHAPVEQPKKKGCRNGCKKVEEEAKLQP